MKQGCCRQHKNIAQIICLNHDCKSRLMCMLCQHNHDFFTSIRNKNLVQLKKFKKIVDDSIDRSLKIVDSIQQNGIQKQKKEVTKYYQNIKQDIIKFIDLRMNQNLALFAPKNNSNLQFLIRSRIEGRYHQLSPQLFEKIKQVYEGKDLETLARQQQQLALQTVYSYMQEFHKQLSELLTKFKIQCKVKIPQIRIKKQMDSFTGIHVENYDEDVHRNKQKQIKKYQNNVQIQMLLTDAYSGKKSIFTIGWDKNLRVFDKNLNIIHTKQYNNVLTRIQPIGDDIFVLGVSKQLHINKITHEDGYDPKQILILKGHTERIWDISSFNTRIIGSCSQEGTKIWDLYKQRCQYTLRQQINPSCMKFMPQANLLAVGYHSHNLKIYSINTMKPTRSYQLPGVPLFLSQQNRNQNLIYCGGFNSDIKLFDMRLTKQVFGYNFKSQAITTFKQSIFDENTLLIGERGGKIKIFDLRKLKVRLEWQAHKKMTNLSKPNGIVRIFQQGFNQILTVGCNDRKAIIWELKNQQ